jgi:tetratricopeptide (TPR) repeat protein
VCVPKADEVQSLVDKSLVRYATPRFTMLEPIRQFAEERLRADAPSEYEQRVQAHADYFVALAERLEPELVTARQPEALDELSADHANLRLALDRASGDAPLRLAAALHRFWHYRGHPHEGRSVLEQALRSHADAEPRVRAKALVGAGTLAVLQSDVDAAQPLLTDAIALGDAATQGSAHGLLAETARVTGNLDAAEQHCREALRLAGVAGDERLVGVVQLQQGTVAYSRGDNALAVQLWRDALATSDLVGDTATAIRAVNNLSVVLRFVGAPGEAVAAAERALELARTVGDRGAEGRALLNLAAAVAGPTGITDVQQLDTPASYARAAIAIFEELGYRRDLAGALMSMPSLVADLEDALPAVARARAIYKELGDDAGVAQADALRAMAIEEADKKAARENRA